LLTLNFLAMNFKGTPGPWVVVSSVQPPIDGTKMAAKYIGTFDIKTEPREGHEPGLWLAAVHPYECSGFTTKDQAAANAKLIAASPDMLDMLIACKEFIKTHMHYPGEGMCDKIQQVIDKALT
jgi:hypothetical protein